MLFDEPTFEARFRGLKQLGRLCVFECSSSFRTGQMSLCMAIHYAGNLA